MKFSKVISLGRAYDVAHQIRRHFNQTEAYPFDWLITPYDGLLETIKSDFNGFIAKENLVTKNDRITNKDSDVIFFHDFEPRDRDKFENDFPAVADKYHRRVERWRRVAEAGDPILFVRGSQSVANGILTTEHAQSILDTISEAYPRCDAYLLTLNETTAGIEPQKVGKIWMDNLILPQPYAWQGDDNDWSEMLNRYTA